MKKLIYALTIYCLLPLQCLAAIVDVEIKPLSTILSPGETTFVDLVGTYDGTDNLLGGAISLNFQADQLEVIGVTLKAPRDFGGSNGIVEISGSSGTISGIGFATFAGVTGNFSLATIEFRALGPLGDSILSAFDPGDPIYAWVNEASENVTVRSTPSLITITAVPLPASFVLMLTGMTMIGRRLLGGKANVVGRSVG